MRRYFVWPTSTDHDPSRPSPSSEKVQTSPPPRRFKETDRPRGRYVRGRQLGLGTRARVDDDRRRATSSDGATARAFERSGFVGRGRARDGSARGISISISTWSRLNTHRHRPRPRGRRGTRGDARSIGAWRGRRRDDALSPDVGETSTRWMGAGREAREMGARTGVGRRGDDGDARGERGRGESAAAAEDRLLGRLDECVVLCEAVRTRRVHAAVSSVH